MARIELMVKLGEPLVHEFGARGNARTLRHARPQDKSEGTILHFMVHMHEVVEQAEVVHSSAEGDIVAKLQRLDHDP